MEFLLEEENSFLLNLHIKEKDEHIKKKINYLINCLPFDKKGLSDIEHL